MSYYIEIKNWDERGPKTFLIDSFNMASKLVEEPKLFTGDYKYAPDPEVTEVSLREGGYSPHGVKVEIAIGYEEFKRALLVSRAANDIPSFDYSRKYTTLLEELKQVPNKVSTARGINQLFLREVGQQKPDLNLLRNLLAKGADPDRRSIWDKKSTPLTKAIQNHNSAVVELLIEFKVNVNALNEPLRHAITNDDLEIVKLMTDAGANPTLRDLDSAFIKPNPHIIQHLLNLKVVAMGDRPISDKSNNDYWLNRALERARATGAGPLIIQMVSDAIERRKAVTELTALKDDPRDTRIAELERQMRALNCRGSSRAAATNREL